MAKKAFLFKILFLFIRNERFFEMKIELSVSDIKTNEILSLHLPQSRVKSKCTSYLIAN